MKRRYAVLALPLYALANLVACRAIVGITDLTVADAGSDVASDRPPPPDAPDARDAPAVGDASVDASADAPHDAKPADAPVVIDCSQPDSTASINRTGCFEGCNSGHPKQIAAYFNAELKCLCSSKTCAAPCEAYCDFAACGLLEPAGECFNCAAYAIQDPGGACNTDAARACAGCESYSACLDTCPDA